MECFTNIKKHTTFAWTLENCISLFDLESPSSFDLESPTFESFHDHHWTWISCQEKLEWQLLLTGNYINPRLKLKSKLREYYGGEIVTVTIEFTFYLLNKEGERVNIKTRKADFRIDSAEHGLNEEFISVSELQDPSKGLLVDGSLTIYCTLCLPSVEHIDFAYSVPTCDIVSCLKSAMTEGLLSDFTVAVGEKEFQVHKLILSVQSPVFRRMIECPMAESANSRVEISDFEPEVVEEMIHYIYTGQAPHLNDMMEPLLNIAEKYELLRLKEMCAEALAVHLDVENATAALVLAEVHNLSKLKTICIRFIGKHFSAVFKTPHWSSLKSQENGLPYTQILESLVRMYEEDFISSHETPCKIPRAK